MAEATTLQALQKALGKSSSSRETNKRIKVPFARQAVGTPMADTYIRPASRSNEMEAVGKSSLLEFIQNVSPAVQKALNTYNEVQDEKSTTELLDKYTKLRAEKGPKAFSEAENDWLDKQIKGRSLKMQRVITDRIADTEAGSIWTKVQERITSEKLFAKTGEDYRARVQQITSEETQKFISERPYLSQLGGFGSTLGARLQHYENGAVNNHLAQVDGNMRELEIDNIKAGVRAAVDGQPTGSMFSQPPLPTEVNEGSNLPVVKDASNAPIIFGNGTGSVEHVNKLNDDFLTRVVAMAQKYYVKTGNKLRVNSAFRDPKDNTRVGGVKNSRHLSGEAIDFPPHQVKQLKEAGLLAEFGFEELSGAGHPEHVQNSKGYKPKGTPTAKTEQDKASVSTSIQNIKGHKPYGDTTAKAAEVNATVLTGIDAQVAAIQKNLDEMHGLYQGTAINVTKTVVEALGGIRNPDLLVAIGEKVKLGTGKLSATTAWIEADMPKYIQDLYTYDYKKQVEVNNKAEGEKQMAIDRLRRYLYEDPTRLLQPVSDEEKNLVGDVLNEKEHKAVRRSIDYTYRNSTQLTPSQLNATSLNIYRLLVGANGDVVGNWNELLTKQLDGRQVSLPDYDAIHGQVSEMVSGANRRKLPITQAIASVVIRDSAALNEFMYTDVRNDINDRILRFVKGLQGNKILGIRNPARVKQVQEVLAASGGFLNLDDTDMTDLGGILMEEITESRPTAPNVNSDSGVFIDGRGRKVGYERKRN